MLCYQTVAPETKFQSASPAKVLLFFCDVMFPFFVSPWGNLMTLGGRL